ncbi:MAG TPA: YceI family protein [Solirubrobacteraceae bacterium]|jgi:polyisoprenoid-binding protein YceI|nr:YceI family protein [Solirubrobacteraceae bacterium]
MSLAAGEHRIDAAQGTLRVHTFREGVAQRVGHDLIIQVESWSGTVSVDADGTINAVSLQADSTSLQVKEGLHGVKPLSDKDRADIRRNIDEKVLRRQPISFASSAVKADDGDAVTLSGELTLVGTTRPADFPVRVGDDGRATATVPLTQSGFGIKPFRALMGALKVSDAVEIAVDVQLPTA